MEKWKLGKFSLCVTLDWDIGIRDLCLWIFLFSSTNSPSKISWVFQPPAIFREEVLFWIQLVKGNEGKVSKKLWKAGEQLCQELASSHTRRGLDGILGIGFSHKGLEKLGMGCPRSSGVIIHGNIPKIMWIWHLRTAGLWSQRFFPTLF